MKPDWSSIIANLFQHCLALIKCILFISYSILNFILGLYKIRLDFRINVLSSEFYISKVSVGKINPANTANKYLQIL